MPAMNIQRLQPRSPRPGPAGPDAGVFCAAIRQLATGVCVVTPGPGEARRGRTVTAVSSLAVEPPTLLVSGSLDLSRYRVFAVNVLAADQREFAQKFSAAGLTSGEGFEDGPWLQLPSGVCCLAGSVAVFDCEVEECIERHSHAILISRVRRALLGEGSGALVRWQGVYDQVGWSRDEISRAVGLSPVAAPASDRLGISIAAFDGPWEIAHERAKR